MRSAESPVPREPREQVGEHDSRGDPDTHGRARPAAGACGATRPRRAGVTARAALAADGIFDAHSRQPTTSPGKCKGPLARGARRAHVAG